MDSMPNIIFIFADDLGYGDVGCFNPRLGKIRTPKLNRLAAEGMAFTDAHSSSSVCSPSRYGVLTGRYNWRSRLQRGIVSPYGAPLIDADQVTLPRLLRDVGYTTACVGKWHLGWDWPCPDESPFLTDRKADADPEADAAVRRAFRDAFTQPIAGGPTTRGFDGYFGVDVPNWPPYCFIQNDEMLGIPTEFLPRGLVGNNMASLPGPALSGWSLENILPTLADKATEFVEREAARDTPFFLYMPLTSPHTPLAVNDRWRGKSGLNRYADLVMETDAVVGRVLDALEASGAAENTMVMFASDNGCAPYIGVAELEAKGHYPSAGFRGYKADAWDGGHRIPLIVRRPGVVRPGSTCNELVCLTDIFATCAEAAGATVPDHAAPDSMSFSRLLVGARDGTTRTTAVHHSITGRFAIRNGRWKLVLCPGSGGWASPRDEEAVKQGLSPQQLYDMADDPAERNNLIAERPDVLERLTRELERQVAEGRSTPGPHLDNDVPVDIWKQDTE